MSVTDIRRYHSMSVAAITRIGRMGRWEPDARGRMSRAAIDLFTERGFEQTTAGDIAAEAGVTERTFFRHFADKREVLFDGSAALEQGVRDAILAAPAGTPPFDAALAGMADAGARISQWREYAVRRAAIIAANPALRERELLKMASLVTAVAESLGERGVAGPDAELAAHSALSVFQLAFGRWVGTEPDPGFATCLDETAAALRALL
jgi:AcrR family transcriptional regulator